MGWSRIEVGVLGALVLLAACGPDVGEPAEDFRAPTCDSDGPVRLLPDVLIADVMELEDRLIVRGLDSLDVESDVRKIWAVGACGEDPVELYEGPWRMRIVDDLLLACDDAGSVHRLDPLGERAPVKLFSSVSCRLELTEAGLLAHDPIAQEIVLHPSPHDDDVEPVSVLGDVPTPGSCESDCNPYRVTSHSVFETDGTSVFVIDAQSRLSRIDLQTRASVVVADGAADFVLLPVPDRLLVEDEAEPDDDTLFHPIRLVDLAAGDSRQLGAVALSFLRIGWPIGVGIVVDPAEEAGFGVRAFDLRTGERVGLPPTVGLLSFTISLDGPHVVLRFDDGPYSLENTTYYAWSGAVADWIEVASFASCSAARQRNDRLEISVWDCEHADVHDVWLTDFDGGEPRLVATGIEGAWLTRPDRIVWSRSSAAVDDLLVTDIHDGHRWRLDTRAQLLSRPLQPEPDLDGDVLYVVHDGDRSGLWRSALP